MSEKFSEKAIKLIKEIREELFTIRIGMEVGFDFQLVALQILIIQTLSYFSLLVLVAFFSLLFGNYVHIDQLFDPKSFSNNSTIVAWLTNGMVSSIWMYLFVRRSKSCLDFTITFHVINFILTTIYNLIIPLRIHWYVVVLLNGFQMYIIGRNLCLSKESKLVDIKIKKTPRKPPVTPRIDFTGVNDQLLETEAKKVSVDENIEIDEFEKVEV